MTIALERIDELIEGIVECREAELQSEPDAEVHVNVEMDAEELLPILEAAKKWVEATPGLQHICEWGTAHAALEAENKRYKEALEKLAQDKWASNCATKDYDDCTVGTIVQEALKGK